MAYSSRAHLDALASFKYRNYRLWFLGQAASLIGTWMQVTAQGFLVFELTHSPAFLGYVGFASGVPIWLLTLFGGVVTDRMSRRDLLVITQFSMMILAFTLAMLTWLSWIQPWHILVLALALGVANAFDAPARQAFVVEMVGREDQGNAIALNATMSNLAISIGPAIAGLFYAWLGPAWCFGINAASFIPVIVALGLMRLESRPRQIGTRTALGDFQDGMRYVAAHRSIRVLLMTAVVVTIFGMSFGTLFPVWAVAVLGGDATTNGFLQSARGIGSLIGTLMIASIARRLLTGKLVAIATGVLPVFLFAFATAHQLAPAILALVGVGWCLMLIVNVANILVQSQVDDAYHGRVMASFTLASQGMVPAGALIVGAMAELFDVPMAVALGAAILFAFAVWLASAGELQTSE